LLNIFHISLSLLTPSSIHPHPPGEAIIVFSILSDKFKKP